MITNAKLLKLTKFRLKRQYMCYKFQKLVEKGSKINYQTIFLGGPNMSSTCYLEHRTELNDFKSSLSSHQFEHS